MKRSMIIILGVVVVVVLVITLISVKRRQCVTTCQAPEIPVAPVVDVPPTNFVAERMSDPVYVESLKSLTQERRQKAGEAHAIRERIEAKVAVAAAALKAEADVAPPATPPAADIDVGKMQDEALQARLNDDPEWVALEAEREQVVIDLKNIQHRITALVRERMKAQVARRKGLSASSPVKPAPVINMMTNRPPMQLPEPVVMTNAPTEGDGRLPVPPERLPVNLPEASVETAAGER